jgi:hypothetical protein
VPVGLSPEPERVFKLLRELSIITLENVVEKDEEKTAPLAPLKVRGVHEALASIAPTGSIMDRFKDMDLDEIRHALKCPGFARSTELLYDCIKQQSALTGGDAGLEGVMENHSRASRILNASLMLRYYPMVVNTPEIRAAAVDMSRCIDETFKAMGNVARAGVLLEVRDVANAAIREFSTTAVRYIGMLQQCEALDTAMLEGKIRSGIEAMMQSQGSLPPPEETPMTAVRVGFEREIWRLTGKLQAMTDAEKTFTYVSSLREKYNPRHGTPCPELTRKELYGVLLEAGFMPGQSRPVSHNELVQALAKFELDDIPGLLFEAGQLRASPLFPAGQLRASGLSPAGQLRGST